MPNLVYDPKAMGMSGFDASAWAGVNVFDRGATSITLPSYTGTDGLFHDPIDFLNGRCSQTGRDLQADGQAAWTASTGGGAGTFEMYLDTDDRFVIRTAVGTDTFEINDGAEYGFTNGQASAVVGAWNVVKATNQWTRAVTDSIISVEPGVNPTFNLPTLNSTIQNPIVALRAYGLADLDDKGGTRTLETADNDAAGGVQRDLRWGINADGKVYAVRRTGTHDPITWVSTSFRDRLGFTGDEVEATDGNYKVLTATCHLPGLIPPSRVTDRHEFEPKSHGASLALMDGSMSGVTLATTIDHRIQWFLDGPGDCVEMWQHFQRRVIPYLGPGTRLTWYQEGIGDTRRAAPAHIVTTSQPAYDVLYTTQSNGYRGRIIGFIHEGDHPIRWPGVHMHRVPMEFLLREHWSG